MKATFVHDFPVFSKEKNIYSYGGFQTSFWKRYLVHIDKLNIICREKNSGIRLENLNRISAPDISVNPVENYSGIKDFHKRKQAFKKMENSIQNTDFVILRLPSILAIDAYKAIKKYKKPYVVEVVGNGFEAFFYNGNILGKLVAPIIHKKMSHIIQSADAAIYVTQDHLQKTYPNLNNTVSISNAEIIINNNKINNNKGKLKEKNKLTIGFLGAMNVKYKNFYVGLKYLQKYFENQNIQVELLIAGGGENKKIDSLAESSQKINVKKIGKLMNREEVNEWFQSLDLFIHPSITEGLPRVVMEAMNNEVPVIASSVGGTPELLSTKFIFDPKEYKSFEETLSNILNSDIEDVINENLNTIIKYNKAILQNKRNKFFYDFINEEIKK